MSKSLVRCPEADDQQEATDLSTIGPLLEGTSIPVLYHCRAAAGKFARWSPLNPEASEVAGVSAGLRTPAPRDLHLLEVLTRFPEADDRQEATDLGTLTPSLKETSIPVPTVVGGQLGNSLVGAH